ncbi:PemK-like, MazF-like toxin of type II toxin-antitoxin system [Promicromonospora umidemergens]|uniref:PemK-like, MazF-like toxin of type II toxin-antitoxin system n=1 Tax=Promicromonospora umidemergens TaxID=629679 RepID=A0ABP8X8N7_9MICO|nr:type II toxin-antitoxin system PemK/MazF family toxin [Promicromonospora umidemergens]MCP2281314.1 PemK-like, MazF-like toxin of type II toxin-antitoxin system [Promicromonospora umidemergens]
MTQNPWIKLLGDVVEAVARAAFDQNDHRPGAGRPTPGTRPAGRRTSQGQEVPDTESYPGDFEGRVTPVYRPELDGEPDPGEVVWSWVPYEEDHSQGKDRPVLLVGNDGPWLLALQLTSQDHDRDAEQENRAGRRWMDIGTGAWDRSGRPSEVRLNRVIRIHPDAVRREGAILDKAVFDQVAAAL